MTLVTVALVSGCSGTGDETYLEEIPGYEDAHEQAAVHCMRYGAGPDYFAVYRSTCVEEETRRSLVADGHDVAARLPWQKSRRAEDGR